MAERQLAESDNISNSFDVTFNKADLIANASAEKTLHCGGRPIDLCTLLLYTPAPTALSDFEPSVYTTVAWGNRFVNNSFTTGRTISGDPLLLLDVSRPT